MSDVTTTLFLVEQIERFKADAPSASVPRFEDYLQKVHGVAKRLGVNLADFDCSDETIKVMEAKVLTRAIPRLLNSIKTNAAEGDVKSFEQNMQRA